MHVVRTGLALGVAIGILSGSAGGALAQDDGPVGGTAVSTSIEFEPCLPGGGRGIPECAIVRAPLDYEDPGGPTVELFVTRHAATGDRGGTLFIEAGGTGPLPGSLLQDLIAVEPLADHLDLVQVYPRELECEPAGADLPGWVSTGDGLADDIDAYNAHVRAVAAACEQANGADYLASLTTANAARDMEQVRQLLGEDRISFLGKSSGTATGWTYALLFPEAVRSMVLDSAITDDPALVNSVARAVAREEQLQRLDRSCDAWDACPVGDIGLLSAIAEVRDRLTLNGSIGTLDGAEFEAAIEALYASPWLILDVAPGLAMALDGDGSMLELVGSPREAIGAREAVVCADGGPFAGTSGDLLEEAERTFALAPNAGPVWSVPCDLWPVSGSGLPAIDDAGSAPIVVVGNSYDAVTPYAWSVALAEELGPDATMLTWDGSGHAAALAGIDRCLDERILAFLVDGEVPEPGAVCPQRGLLGVRVDYTVTPNLVSGVLPGSAADLAGVEVGDIILEANGEPVGSILDVPEGAIGEELGLTLRRGDEIVEVSIARGAPVWELWRFTD